MFDKDEIKKIREITKEEIKKFGIIDYINQENEKQIIEKEITEVNSDLREYDRIFNLYSIEYRLKLLERLILNIEKINKIVLKLILALFIISLVLLISFIILRFAF